MGITGNLIVGLRTPLSYTKITLESICILDSLLKEETDFDGFSGVTMFDIFPKRKPDTPVYNYNPEKEIL